MLDSVNRIAADTDGGGLSVTERGKLRNRFVCQSSGAGNHADMTLAMDVLRHNADINFSRRHDARAVRSEKQ